MREVDLRNGSDAMSRSALAQDAVDPLQHLPIVSCEILRQLADCPIPLRATMAAAFPGIVRQGAQQGCRALPHPSELRHDDQGVRGSVDRNLHRRWFNTMNPIEVRVPLRSNGVHETVGSSLSIPHAE